MASSLQQQLAAIAANSTHQLDLKAQKAQHSKSLLFSPRDAATQNFDSVYQLCLEGFDELCQLDSRFVPFARNLFSEQSKNEDRTTMTAKENSELDSVIEKFLALLGGRLLLKPGMKAAEWMVRRFRVHEYNTQALLLTFLPYHAQPIFPTLLSILPEQLPPIFRFLHPYVASLQTLPRHAVVTSASNNPAFFTALSEYVLEAAKMRYQSAMLLGFWASVTAQAVNGMVDATRSGREAVRKQKEEDVLLRVIPTLQKALGVKVPELYLGSCMIMTILACKASLSERVLNAMMEAVAGGWTEQTVEDGLTCLAVLAEEKQQLHLPRKVTRAVLQQDDSLDIIQRIGLKCRADRLLVGIAQGAIAEIVDKRDSRATQLLGDILESASIPRGHTVLVLEATMKAIVDLPASKQENNGRKELLLALSGFGENEGASQLIELAAQKSQIDLTQLDANLALQLEAAPESEDDSDEDVKMLDSSAPSDPSLDLSELPRLPSKDSSFLDVTNQQLFDSYVAAFQKALPSDQDLAALLNLHSLQRSTCEQRPAVLTFFARCWTSSVPASARLKALHITRGLLEEIKKGDHSIDMQALVPYLIAGLADPIKAIRSAAASTCLALSGLYQNKPGKSKASGDVRVWSKDIFYGTDSSKIQRLSAADAQRFMNEALLPILEDCVVDANYIVQTLADSINATSATSHSDRKELKASIRTSVYGFLASHLVATPVLDVKMRLASILSKVGKIAGTARGHIILPYAREYFTETLPTSTTTEVVTLSKALASCLTHRSAEEVQLLKALASGEFGSETERVTLGFARLRQLWSAMKQNSQQDLVDWSVELSLKVVASEETQTEAVDTLRNLSLPTEILVHLVERLPTVSDLQGQPPSTKKQRTSRVSDVSKTVNISKDKLNAAIRRITLVLELVEESKPERHSALLKGLFYFLSELHHYKLLLDSELVYLQGLLINALLDVVNGLLKAGPGNKEELVDRSVIRADLIVECVRTTSSTQVHHASLLLMSALASWAPDLVLHSVMPLFTFMSSTILKQGDDYSAHVTDQTVARIIPPLAASLKKRGKDLISGASELLLSFTAAWEHIPLHRRAGLFRHLVQTLGAGESLFAVSAMLVERYPDQGGVLPFVAELMGEFGVEVQLGAVRQYLDLVGNTLKVKRGLADVILGYGEKDGEQAKMATSVLLGGLSEILVRDALKKKLAKQLKKDEGGKSAETLRVTYSVLLEKSMSLGLQLKADETLHDSANRVLTALLGLMPTKDFIDASAMLMQSGSDEIRQQVFWSLEQRVKSAKRGDVALQSIFGETLSNCAIFVAKNQPVPTRIAAITCIDNIAEKFGKTDRDAVMRVATEISGPAALGDDDLELRRMSLLCLASMLEVLGDGFIPLLGKTTEFAIKYLGEELEEEEEEERDYGMVTAGFSYAMAVLDYVPYMLTGKFLDELLVLSAKANNYHAKQFTELAAKTVEANSLFTSVQKTMPAVEKLGRDAMGLHMETLLDAITHHPKSTIAKNAPLLLGTLLEAFDLRRKLPPSSPSDSDSSSSSVSSEDEESTPYDLVTQATMSTVLKLNDATFRPFFTKLVAWAGSLPIKDVEGKRYREISLWSFAFALFDQLKSLVTSYAGFLLESAANILSNTDEKSAELNDLALQTLTANFTHDADGFWQSPSHFEAIAGPLLGLLGVPDKHSEYLIPAITSLAAAAGSPEHHKVMNTAIMAFMRSEEKDVRLMAVKVERALTEKLHVDWISLLPEMLPVISELQEDDCGEIESEVGRWIAQIEEVTGVGLEGMLQ
jgi:U3 small nucleolar RNA-associated protein 10